MLLDVRFVIEAHGRRVLGTFINTMRPTEAFLSVYESNKQASR